MKTPKAKKVIEVKITKSHVDLEDSGCAKIVHCNDIFEENQDEGMFVRLHSWSNTPRVHPELDQFIGRKVRITVETID
jgi:hypothetical protein